ncbi:MAG: DUF3347 domain-containing protein [Bacteroidetes bacterium]|nr:DUF3347 domain-containing protein [Bacteroidota bacterium]
MRKYLLYGIAVLLASCQNGDKKATQPDAAHQPPVALSQSANSEAFNLSFGEVMTQYYALTDHFIAENDTGITAASQRLVQATDSLKLDELKADTNIVATARSYAIGISSELKGLLGETEPEPKRKSFQLVSEQLYDLVRTVHYDRQIIYQFYCADAFSDQGGTWLSHSRQVRNPYLPKKKLDCGELRDSLDFRH